MGEGTRIGWPPSLAGVLVGFVVLGIAAFGIGVGGDSALRAWQIYLVNYLFWSGIAVAGVVLAAIFHITHSVWGKAFQGIAVAGAGFFPVSLMLFFPLTLAGGTLFPWFDSVPEHRATWMSPAFVFTRDGLGLFLLMVLAGAFVYYRVRPAVGVESGVRNRRGLAEEDPRAERILTRMAPVLFIVYALVSSLLAFDLVNALDPHFVSTLFGGYFFFGSLYAAVAWLALVSFFIFRAENGHGPLAPEILHPLGKLLFGFCMFHGMLFFSQYLPIWYGNLPEEIEFVIVRSQEGFWPWVSAAFVLASLVLPFCILLSRAVKEHGGLLAGVALLVLAGMWLDRFVLVVPSVWHEQAFPFGWLEAAITAGFAALVLLCYWGFSRFVPLSDFEPPKPASPL